MPKLSFFIILSAFLFSFQAKAYELPDSHYFPLKAGWSLKETRHAQGIVTTVPGTVLGAILSERKNFDPFFGNNLEPFSGDSGKGKFDHAWWYQKYFELPENFSGKKIHLHLRGLNYSAEVWLNGKLIAGPDTLVGTYRTFELNLTNDILERGQNKLEIKINPPTDTDLTASWVDWNPHPSDQNMGLWREVYLSASNGVSISNPMVVTHLNHPSDGEAHLQIESQVSNLTHRKVLGRLEAEIDGREVALKVELKANETKTVIFDSAQFAALNLPHPRLWWPAQMGMPNIYSLHLKFEAEGRVLDRISKSVGLREVTSELTASGARLFKINGKPIQIRGGGYASDLFLRFSKERMLKELQYVKHLNLNTVRLEGMMQPEYFYELTDKMGILVMPGWVCCNSWQDQSQWAMQTYLIAQASLHDQLMELRSHPSVFVFLYGSDMAPPLVLERLYLSTIWGAHWPNPTLSSASADQSILTGKSGVKMTGPYDYVGPTYWLQDQKNYGGAWGFNTETSPGPAVPPIESLKEFIPKQDLWPMNATWNFHAGLGEFKNIDIFKNGLEGRYGPTQSVEEFAMKSQVMAYDNERAMFEAYGKNKYHSATGVVQWMLNNSWPSLIWHLYDYYLRAGGGFYGVKKALEPIHIQYSYDDHSIVVVNSTYENTGSLFAKAEVFDLLVKPIFSTSVDVSSLAPDFSQKVLQIPELSNLPTTYFLKLTLSNSEGHILSHNFYWLSNVSEVYDWSQTKFTHTPIIQEADLVALNNLPKAHLQIENVAQATEHRGVLKLRNQSQNLAFAVHFKLVHSKGGKEVLPTLWDDNYISLTPGESRSIHYSYGEDETDSDLEVITDGWNL